MKNIAFKGSAKIAVAIMLLVSLVCLAGVCVTAAEEQTGLEIGQYNLEYNKNTHIIVTLVGEAPAGQEKGIAVWDYTVEGELTLANASFLNFEVETDSKGVEYYATQGIPAAALSEEYTIAPVTKDAEGNVAIAGALVKRSAFGYVAERLGDEGLMGYQVDLYRDLVVYGTSAEQVLGDKVANKNVVVAKGGYVGNAISPLQFATGDEALLRAGVQNANGEYFSHWEDAFGNFVTGERVVNVDVKAGLNYYNAVYTDKASSAYGEFADFNSFDEGKYEFDISTKNLTDDEKTKGQAVRALPLFTNLAGVTNGFRSIIRFDNSDLTLDTPPITAETPMSFNTLYNGSKYLNINKNLTTSGEYYQTIISNYEDTSAANTERLKYERFEIDVNLAATNLNAVTCFNLFFDREETGGGRAKIQFYIGKFYSNGTNYLRIHYYPSGATKIIDIPIEDVNKIFTIAMDVDANGVCNLYVDGVALTLESPITPYSGSSLVAGTWHPSFLQIYGPANSTYDYNIYSIGLVDTDKTKTN